MSLIERLFFNNCPLVSTRADFARVVPSIVVFARVAIIMSVISIMTLAIAFISVPSSFAAETKWVDVAQDPNDSCLNDQALSSAEENRVMNARGDLANLNWVRDGVSRTGGHNYSEWLKIIEDEYLPASGGANLSHMYQDEIAKLIRLESLKQQLYLLIGLENSEYVQFDELVRSIGMGDFGFANLYGATSDLAAVKKVVASLDHRIVKDTQKQHRSMESSGQAASDVQKYLELIAKTDMARAQLQLVFRDLLDTLQQTRGRLAEESILVRDEMLQTAGWVVLFGVSVSLFEVSVPAITLAALTNSLKFEVGTVLNGCLIGSVGEGTSAVVRSRNSAAQQAYMDSANNHTSYACELSKNKDLAQPQTMRQTIIGAAEGGLAGCLGMTGIIALAKVGWAGTAIKGIIPAVALTGAKDMGMSTVYGARAKLNEDAYRAREYIALAYPELRAQNLELAKHYLQQAQMYAKRASDSETAALIESLILLTAGGEIREALSEMEHGLEKILAFVSKSSDNVAYSVQSFTQVPAQMGELKRGAAK